MNTGQRVGVFQAEWPLQSHAIYTAIALAQANYSVDLFLYKTVALYDLEEVDRFPNIQIYLFSDLDTGEGYLWKSQAKLSKFTVLKQLKRFYLEKLSILALLGRYLTRVVTQTYEQFLTYYNSEAGLPPLQVLQKTRSIVRSKHYHCLIGIEKVGLIWAGRIAQQFDIPFVYHSLELFTRDHPETQASARAQRIKLLEEKYHQQSHGTIVQDARRAEILLKDNRVTPQHPTLYMPISILGSPYRQSSSLLQQKLQLTSQHFIILQFGFISELRLSLELTAVAQTFPAEWILVFHGLGAPASVRKVEQANTDQRVILSLERLPVKQIPQLIASAHIGLVLYQSSPLNDYLTAFSSEKLALYLQCGVPVIAFAYPGYEIIEQYHCGVTIQTLTELPQAIKKIQLNYKQYCENAYQLFCDCYEFSRNYQTVVEFLKSLKL